MKTVDKILAINTSKNQIRNAIISRGVDVPENTTFRDYSKKIKEIGSDPEGNIRIHWISEKDCPYYLYENKNLASRIDSIDFFGSFKNPDLSYLLYGMPNLKHVGFHGLYSPTSLEHIFDWSVDQESVDSFFRDHIKDVSHLTNISIMFERKGFIEGHKEAYVGYPSVFNGAPLEFANGALAFTPFTTIDVSGWDFTHMKNAAQLFANNENLTSVIGLENWNNTNEIILSSLFYKCTSLVSLDMSKSNITNVIRDSSMFAECTKLTTLNISGVHTSSKINPSLNYNNEGRQFYNCTSLTTVIWPNDFLNYVPNLPADSFSLHLETCPLNHDTVLNLFRVIPTLNSNQVIMLSPTSKKYMNQNELNIAKNKGWTIG